MSVAHGSPKSEPVSPLDSSVDEAQWDSDTDTGLYWTEQELLEAGLSSCETKVEALTKILENLEQLADLGDCIKTEDQFSNYWMEEKMLPIYELPLSPSKPDEKQPVGCDPTQTLLIEFENVLDAVNNGAFTPPQSPPYQQPVLTTLETASSSNVYATASNDHTYPTAGLPIGMPATPQPDVAHELAVVDELVRTRAEFLVPSSPGSSSSTYGDCSSDDPEWTADPSESYKSQTAKFSRKRSSPYGDDRKSRKKEQNKNAATRYRMKKKAEVEEILGEEKQVLDKNSELGGNIADLQREIKYLKGLMHDLFKAKGLIE